MEPWPVYKATAEKRGAAKHIHNSKEVLDQIKKDVRQNRLKKEDVDRDSIIASCPLFSVSCSMEELLKSEAGCVLPLYLGFLRWAMCQCLAYVVVGLIVMFAIYVPMCVIPAQRDRDRNLDEPWTWSYIGAQECKDRADTWPMVLACATVYWYTHRGVLAQRIVQKNLTTHTDSQNTDPHDYAVYMKGLPKDVTEHEIAEFIRLRGFELDGFNVFPEELHKYDDEINIVKVLLCKDCTEAIKLENRLDVLRSKRISVDNSVQLSEVAQSVAMGAKAIQRTGRRSNDSNPDTLNSRSNQDSTAPDASSSSAPLSPRDKARETLEAEIAEIKSQLSSPSLIERAQMSGAAIVIFKEQRVANAIVRRWADSKREFRFRLNAGLCKLPEKLGLLKWDLPMLREHKVSLHRADNPNNIRWENLAVTHEQRLRGIFVQWIVMGILLGTCFAANYAVMLWKKAIERDEPDNQRKLQQVSLLLAGTVQANNGVLTVAAYVLAPLGRAETLSQADTDLMWMLALAYIINTCLINVLVYHRREDWIGSSGLATQAFSMCLSNAFCPLMWIYDYPAIIRRFMRWRWERATDKERPLSEHERRHYESFFEPTIFDLSAQYAGAIKTVILTVIYAPLIPVAAPFLCIISLCSQYIADKTFALKFGRKPYTSINAVRARAAVDFIDVAALFGGVFAGMFIGYNGTNPQVSFLAGVGSSIGLFAVKLLPTSAERKIMCMFRKKHKLSDLSTARDPDYYDAQMFWESRHMYHKSHPLYKHLPETLNPKMLNHSVTLNPDSTLSSSKVEPAIAVNEVEPPPSCDVEMPPPTRPEEAPSCFFQHCFEWNC